MHTLCGVRQFARYRTVRLVFLLGLCLSVWGCGSRQSPLRTPADCVESGIERIEAAPVQDSLQTLDGQEIPLAEFITLCRQLFPACSLYPKFYHWKQEVKKMVAQTPRGRVSHRVRVYFNLMSTCYPDQIDPGQTHGDVAEFYDGKGTFMGLAVYMGKGLYCPLPHTGYKGSDSRFDIASQFKSRF